MKLSFSKSAEVTYEITLML